MELKYTFFKWKLRASCGRLVVWRSWLNRPKFQDQNNKHVNKHELYFKKKISLYHSDVVITL